MLKRKDAKLSAVAKPLIPKWLPAGAKKAATLIIGKVSTGKEPKAILNRLKRLIDDNNHVEAMWKKLEKSASKAVADSTNKKESIDDRLFMQ